MKKVTEYVWQEKAANFQNRIAANPYPKKLDYYRKIVDMVTVGVSVLDVGCGDCHLSEVLPKSVQRIFNIDPFPRDQRATKLTAEALNYKIAKQYETVFCLAALDNVQDVELALKGMLHQAKNNIVIVTGIDIPNYPDALHTHRITRQDLTNVLGEPTQEIEMSKNVWLFEWMV